MCLFVDDVFGILFVICETSVKAHAEKDTIDGERERESTINLWIESNERSSNQSLHH